MLGVGVSHVVVAKHPIQGDCVQLTLSVGAQFGPITQKPCNRERWGDKAGNEDYTLEAENKSDDIFEWTVKDKQESDERYAVVARSREIQTNGGPSNGPARQCHLHYHPFDSPMTILSVRVFSLRPTPFRTARSSTDQPLPEPLPLTCTPGRVERRH